ncbi:MAG: hypothetical protein L3J46_05060 [Kangiellaceae bacterium]|nr:hypothetical protein [Kangiellaceae bacterium]
MLLEILGSYTKKGLTAFLSVGLLIMSGCSGSDGSSDTNSNSNNPPTNTNSVPTVNAGQDQSTTENTSVVLTSDASDTDGTISSYEWKQVSGTSVSLSDPAEERASFVTPSLIGSQTELVLEFEISVLDNAGAKATDSVIITVHKAPTSLPALDCDLTISPGDSFIESFSNMSSNQVLCLNDGKYQQAMDIPSNMHVRAVNDGQAEIDGNNELGEEWTGALLQLHGSNSSVRGLKVHHARTNSDTCHISGSNNIMSTMSCSHGGRHKHKIPLKIDGTGHLIEDSWAYGEGRYVIQCFIGSNIILRRNVARWDSTIPNEPTEPNAAFSIYNCSDMTIENNISLDYGIPETAMSFGGDFYSPQNASVYPQGNQNNHWLGNIAINHSASTDNRRGQRFDPATDTFNNRVKDFYVRGSDVAFVSNDRMKSIDIASCTLLDVGQLGSIPGQPEIDCGGGADITKRYINRVKTDTLLFPWLNEDLIKADMCANNERQSDWCSSNLSLSDYILN